MPRIKKLERTKKAIKSRIENINAARDYKINCSLNGKRSRANDRNRAFYCTVTNLQPGLNYRCVAKKYALQVLIGSIIKNISPIIFCSHYLIGSSQFKELLRCSVSIGDNHQVQSNNTIKNRYFGKIAEIAAAEMFKDLKKTEGKISRQLPFLCAKPDFFVDFSKKAVIEIKSTSDPTKVLNILKNRDVMFQILVSMEIYEVEYAELLIYLTNEKLSETSLKCRCLFEKKTSIFTPKIMDHAINGYIGFLASFFSVCGFSLDSKEIEMIRYTFETNFCRTLIKEPKALSAYSTSELCDKALPFYKPKFDFKGIYKKGDSILSGSQNRLEGVLKNSIDCLRKIQWNVNMRCPDGPQIYSNFQIKQLKKFQTKEELKQTDQFCQTPQKFSQKTAHFIASNLKFGVSENCLYYKLICDSTFFDNLLTYYQNWPLLPCEQSEFILKQN